ncbi:uncharacterized protein LOC122975443 isoform X2, partial [Scomber scombrus]
VGDVHSLQLLQITVNPKHVYMVDDFNGLQHIVNDLIINICANSSLGPKVFIIRLVVLLVILLLFTTAVYFIPKASRGQKSDPQENIEMDCYNLGVSRAEEEPAEEEGAQGAE